MTNENATTNVPISEEIEVIHLPVDAFDESSLKRLEKFRPLLGTSEIVKVRQVRLSLMPLYGSAILSSDEAAVVEIYCDREPGWADTLCPTSVERLADIGLVINLPFFSGWFKRQTKWRESHASEAVTDLRRMLGELTTTIEELRPGRSSTPAPIPPEAS